MYNSGNEKHAGSCREKWAAWGISAAVHVLLFLLLASLGVFSLFRPSADDWQALDVTIYDAEAEAGGGGEQSPPAGGSAESAGVEISLPSEAALPQIHEEYTKSPERQEEYRQKHQQKPDSPAESGEKNSSADAKPLTESNGSGDGQEAQGTQGRGGSGDSSARGAGNGAGSGTGNGGSEAGTGRDPAAAQRPKTPPQLLQSQNPRYPRDLEDQGIGGTVLLSLLVGDDGGVQSVSVAASSGYAALDAAAVEAGYGYRFLPARNVYDEPVACRISKRIIFQP